MDYLHTGVPWRSDLWLRGADGGTRGWLQRGPASYRVGRPHTDEWNANRLTTG